LIGEFRDVSLEGLRAVAERPGPPRPVGFSPKETAVPLENPQLRRLVQNEEDMPVRGHRPLTAGRISESRGELGREIPVGRELQPHYPVIRRGSFELDRPLVKTA